MAEPSRRNSGFEATSISRSGRRVRKNLRSFLPVPTGTVDLVTMSVGALRFSAISSAAEKT